MKDGIQVWRSGDRLVLSWGGGKNVAVDLSKLEEIWVLQIGDGFAGPNEQVVLMVDPEGFVGVSAATPGLLGAIRMEIEELLRERRVQAAGLASLPKRWRTGRRSLFPTAEMEPMRRDRIELEEERGAWALLSPQTYEELFP